MKATGIVRRIDDLGRVVIPKEIRRTLRIREGDPLEIFVDREGEVVLKKYSPIGELGEFAQEYAESLHETMQHITLITDRDSVIAVAGTTKKDYLDRTVGALVESAMKKRKIYAQPKKETVEIIRGFPEEYQSYVVVPINTGGDPLGTVVILSKKDGVRMGDTESKLASTAAAFLGKQMQQ